MTAVAIWAPCPKEGQIATAVICISGPGRTLDR